MAKTDLYVKAGLCRGPASSVNTRIIAALEAGTVPRLDAVHNLAQALGVHPVWLAFGEDHKFPGWLADASLEGLALGPTFARTNSPLLGALEEDAIVVEAEGNAPPPGLTLGRAALRDAGCSSISVDRRTRRLTLTCAS